MSYKLKTKKSDVMHASKMALGGLAAPKAKTLGIVSLEPRILLDAAGFVTGAEVAMETLVSEDAQYGVQAIFEGGDIMSSEAVEAEIQHQELLSSLSQSDALQSVGSSDSEGESLTPRDGPWLGDTEASTPRDGPWLGDTEASTPRDGPWLGDTEASTPRDGPWLGDTESLTPRDGPWL